MACRSLNQQTSTQIINVYAHFINKVSKINYRIASAIMQLSSLPKIFLPPKVYPALFTLRHHHNPRPDIVISVLESSHVQR